ncbi:MAG: helix-turn-helix transcriptional regulator [Verrucomicrobia bacterium]|nr:helix-turn-helix transcriptional regulator [Verrucomicrobiota bacterium]
MQKRDPVLVALGQNIRRHRDVKGFSQEVLAEKAGLDRTYISDIERGARNPGIKNVVRIARALGITAAKLLEGVDG